MENAEGEYQIQHKIQIFYIGVECHFNDYDDNDIDDDDDDDDDNDDDDDDIPRHCHSITVVNLEDFSFSY